MFIFEFAGDLNFRQSMVTEHAIRAVLERKLNYSIHHDVIDESYYVPQRRERTYIVGFDRRRLRNSSMFFAFPPTPPKRPSLRSYLEQKPDPSYTVSREDWKRLQAMRSPCPRNDDGQQPIDLNEVVLGAMPVLSADEGRASSANLIRLGPRRGLRRLTPVEYARLAGFEDKVSTREEIMGSDDLAYSQFANATIPAVAEAVAAEGLRVFDRARRATTNGLALHASRRSVRRP